MSSRRRSSPRPKVASSISRPSNPPPKPVTLAAEVDKDPRLVEVILSESVRVVRARRNVLIVEHRLGFIMANAGVDQSNVGPADGASRALLLPENPDRSAESLRRGLAAATGIDRRGGDQRQFRTPMASGNRRRRDRRCRPARR